MAAGQGHPLPPLLSSPLFSLLQTVTTGGGAAGAGAAGAAGAAGTAAAGALGPGLATAGTVIAPATMGENLRTQ